MATVWRLITHWHEPKEAAAWSRSNGRIGMGWNPGDVRRFSSPRAISDAVRDAHPGLPNWPFSGQQLWDFSRVMQQGDLVILSVSSYRDAVVQVTGDYEYHNEEKEGVSSVPFGLHHQRTAAVTALNPDRLWQAAGKRAPGYGIYWTLIRCALPVDEKAMKMLGG